MTRTVTTRVVGGVAGRGRQKFGGSIGGRSAGHRPGVFGASCGVEPRACARFLSNLPVETRRPAAILFASPLLPSCDVSRVRQRKQHPESGRLFELPHFYDYSPAAYISKPLEYHHDKPTRLLHQRHQSSEGSGLEERAEEFQ